ncbi:MucBP domain-containing protein [Lacticaseibacillus yichunensis]|uniref:MucBP domain-containing protein n=1 Tax=Lacticaseibacillus yichunensis TaxID=2486015 RepID=A0ABW4CL46_9LACO|nr:MucBP domain-containing protein [Lacticaseibacillus yichunensis]
MTYIYRQAPVAGAAVTVSYVDQNGQPLTEPLTLTGNLGDPFTTDAKTFAGYTLTASPKNATGVFSDEPQSVTYLYRQDPVQAGTVTVVYVDENDQPLRASTLLNGAVGETFTTQPEVIPGYLLTTIPANATGVFTTAPQTVRYVYAPVPAKIGTVTVRYVDENDQPLTDSVILQGAIRTSFQAPRQSFAGYTLTKVIGSEKNAFGASPLEVVYVYSRQETATGGNHQKATSTPPSGTPAITISPKSAAPTRDQVLPKTGERASALMPLGLFILGALSIALLPVTRSKRER